MNLLNKCADNGRDVANRASKPVGSTADDDEVKLSSTTYAHVDSVQGTFVKRK